MLCVRRLWKNRNKLSFRLTRIYALLFTATMLSLSLIVYFVSWHFLLDRREKELLGSAENIVEIYYEEIAEGGDPLDPQVLWELNTSENMALALLAPQRRPLSQAVNFDVAFSEIPECEQRVVLYSQADGLPLLAWERNILVDGESLGSMVILLRVDGEYTFLDMLAWLLVVLNFAGIFAALAVGWYTSKRMLTPVSSIIREAEAIGEGALHTRLEVPEADDELRLLATTLNEMLDRVETAFIHQGRFTQDASHELRTPLAVLQGNADLLARWGKDDPDVRDKCIAAIQKQVAYMHHLVANLLFLSRGDSGVQALQREKVVLSALLSEIMEERRQFDGEHPYLLRTEAATLFVDASLIRQLMLILLDNAAKYTPSGGAIAVSAVRSDHGVKIDIQDEGCGVPPDQLASIFERFFRVDKARARETGGTGLGLAIAKTIVQMHGGKIWAENGLDCGLIVHIVLPDFRQA